MAEEEGEGRTERLPFCVVFGSAFSEMIGPERPIGVRSGLFLNIFSFLG